MEAPQLLKRMRVINLAILLCLGDGRAVLLGEHISNKNNRFDIQFKGFREEPHFLEEEMDALH
jgi:hypothetical protein